MEYTLIRYHHTPDHVLVVTSTHDAAQAVALLRHWHRAAPEDGVVVRLGDREVVHCTPRE
jgi:hypothetical protein